MTVEIGLVICSLQVAWTAASLWLYRRGVNDIIKNIQAVPPAAIWFTGLFSCVVVVWLILTVVVFAAIRCLVLHAFGVESML